MMGMVTIALQLKPIAETPWLERPEIMIPGSIAALAIIVMLCLWVIKLPTAFRARKGGVLDPIQLEELMPGVHPVIVDLRPRDEFLGKHGHIRSAISVPLSELRTRLEEIRKESKGKPVVLVDETDELSHEIKRVFEANGFTWLYVLKGGLRAWRAGNLPIYKAEQDSR
ncbi:MAG: rhodanese-like domain-containing protein [Holophagaceae bacterium]|nr:rhodanese-like domain-containing protein [Holophagaceae bacterium]